MSANSSDLLTISEASALLRLRPSTLRAWILKRRIPHVKLGSRVFIRRSDIDALVLESVVPASAASSGLPAIETAQTKGEQ
jgi:excisionase family DNA binding protein